MPIERSKYSKEKNKLKDMFLKHNEEISRHTLGTDANLNLDDAAYLHLENTHNHLAFHIVDNDKNKIGYVSIFTYDHHHHKHLRVALTDAFFIDPMYRGYKSFFLISEALKEAETILKTEYNVQYLYLSTSARRDLKFLADSLGYDPSDVIYVKKLE